MAKPLPIAILAAKKEDDEAVKTPGTFPRQRALHKACMTCLFVAEVFMRFAWASAAVLAIGYSQAWSEVAVTKPEACLNARTAVMRLDTIAETIETCTTVINNKSLPVPVHADAVAQRGILYARLWRLTDLPQHAHRGIADITEGLRFNVFKDDKRRLLLIWRGELFEGTKQPAKASDDFRAVLGIAPSDETARAALRRLDAPTN